METISNCRRSGLRAPSFFLAKTVLNFSLLLEIFIDFSQISCGDGLPKNGFEQSKGVLLTELCVIKFLRSQFFLSES